MFRGNPPLGLLAEASYNPPPPSCATQIKSEDGVPLAGVLLSLSGAQFRSNLLTQDTGLLTFNNLVGVQEAAHFVVNIVIYTIIASKWLYFLSL